jgi:hypothetical protein
MPRKKPIREKCNPFSKILVKAFAPGLEPETVNCTSNADFIVYGTTNSADAPGWGYSITVSSTGFGMGSASPTFVVGASAGDTITFEFLPGVTGFLTLQTECGAKASVKG